MILKKKNLRKKLKKNRKKTDDEKVDSVDSEVKTNKNDSKKSEDK